MKAFFEKFESLKGASFIGLKEYENKAGEVANIGLLTNISTMNAKKKDLQKLMLVTESMLVTLSVSTGIKLDFFKIGLTEMIESAQKNVSSDSNEHTVNSQAQTDAYVHLAPGIKLHKDSMNVFIDGFLQSKTVIPGCEGVYKPVKSNDKTLAKKAIGKFVELRMNDYRQYNLGNVEQIKVAGSTLQVIK